MTSKRSQRLARFVARSLQAFPTMTLAYGLMNIGTLCRILAVTGSGWMYLSVVLGVGAYGLFLAQYAAILLTPKVKV